MKAMVLPRANTRLELRELPEPELAPNQVKVNVTTCGVCRTDLHIMDGDLTSPKLPLVLGHEVVGTIAAIGSAVENLSVGMRVGIPWLGETCGQCEFCLVGKENLCNTATFTGYTRDGGYADTTVANARFCFPLPDNLSDEEMAPMLCAGLIGWRTLKMAGDGKRLGIYGFGAAAHIIIQIALYQGREVFAFTRKGDSTGQTFARSLGATWAGASEEMPPQLLDAALIFAPVGGLIPLALKASKKGATIVSGGIHMSDIPSFPYADLWEERSIKSVANLTRQDAIEFFEVAGKVPVHTKVTTYDLSDANQALTDLREGRLTGAAVLRCAQKL